MLFSPLPVLPALPWLTTVATVTCPCTVATVTKVAGSETAAVSICLIVCKIFNLGCISVFSRHEIILKDVGQKLPFTRFNNRKIAPALVYIPFNPYLTIGFSHHYQLGEATSVLRGIRCDF